MKHTAIKSNDDTEIVEESKESPVMPEAKKEVEKESPIFFWQGYKYQIVQKTKDGLFCVNLESTIPQPVLFFSNGVYSNRVKGKQEMISTNDLK